MTGGTSSISTSEDLARKLFKEIVVTTAQRLAPRRLLEVEPYAAGSFFVTPSRPAMSLADLKALGASDILAELARIWRAEGLRDLLPLVDGFGEIRDRLAETPTEGDGSAPELIYTLY